MVLYISYDGLLEPLGQSQVYQYLLRVSEEKGYPFQLITFEKPSDLNRTQEIHKIKEALKKNKITWYPLRYHKSPTALATSYDLFVGGLLATYICLRHKIIAVHTRSYVPSVIGLYVKKCFGVPFIFDMRGFWADEKIDTGAWSKNARLYKLAKWFERKFLLNAFKVISLSRKGVKEMQSWPYLKGAPADLFRVIPTCTNLKMFSLKNRAAGPRKNLNVGYVGSASSWYAFEPAVICFKALQAQYPGATLTILNRGDHAEITRILKAHGVLDFKLREATHEEIPKEMVKMDLTLFFIKPFYSKIASAPTKLAEFLACGVPCITSRGIGDMDQILEDENVGIVSNDFSDSAVKTAASQVGKLLSDETLPQRCFEAAQKYFSLDTAIEAYDQIYKEAAID